MVIFNPGNNLCTNFQQKLNTQPHHQRFRRDNGLSVEVRLLCVGVQIHSVNMCSVRGGYFSLPNFESCRSNPVLSVCPRCFEVQGRVHRQEAGSWYKLWQGGSLYSVIFLLCISLFAPPNSFISGEKYVFCNQNTEMPRPEKKYF